MQFHWKVLLWMLAGLVVGLGLQLGLEAPAWSGARWRAVAGGVEVVEASGPAGRSLAKGAVFEAAVKERGAAGERRVELREPADFEALLRECENGEVVWLVPAGGGAQWRALALAMDPGSARARVVAPFAYVADLFLALLKMLIVPLILSSIVSGVASIGTLSDLRRLGLKTGGYYVLSSLLAIVLGQTLVNLIRPGEGAVLGLSPAAPVGAQGESLWDILRRAIPENVPSALTDNARMLEVIFFALLFGYFVTRAAEPHSTRIRELFESFFEVMLKLAGGVLKLLPYGVFALIVKVVASTGVTPFVSLLLYMLTVTLALVLHACVTLPLLLWLLGRVSPRAWFRAMTPALVTAFSTSSSSMTLPVTLDTVERRGKVSNKISSFTLPLGATINMDGTALYECIGVIFLAQYYAGVGGHELSLMQQGLVAMLALLASIGAAGIPSAGLVMMLTILAALDLPVEGAALLLAVDRPLDMLRTVVNVWSDTCGAAVIARSEGELGDFSAEPDPPGPAG